MRIKGTTIEINISQQNISIIQMIADEMSRKEISKKTSINIRTLEHRLDVLRESFGCKTITGLVVHFLRNNLIK